jgi:hypothetical protein
MAIDDLDMNDDDGMGSILSFDMDISELEKPEVLPEGAYLANITKAERKVSTTSGNPYLALTFHIPPEAFPATYNVDYAPEGVYVVHRRTSLVMTHPNMYRLKVMCDKLGVVAGKNLDLNDFIGRSVMLHVVHREWEGEQQVDIKSFDAA